MSTSTRKPMPTRSGHLRDEFNPETLMALNALSRVIGSDMSLDALLNATVPLIKQLLDVDICLILLHERDQARLSLRASVPRLDEETFDLYPADVPPEAWSCIRQVVHQDGRQERFEALKEVPGMALISGPLIAHDEHLGHAWVVGDAALTVDPTNVEALAEALVRVLSDEALAADLRARGPQHAARFTWHKTASDTLAAYQAAIR